MNQPVSFSSLADEEQTWPCSLDKQNKLHGVSPRLLLSLSLLQSSFLAPACFFLKFVISKTEVRWITRAPSRQLPSIHPTNSIKISPVETCNKSRPQKKIFFLGVIRTGRVPMPIIKQYVMPYGQRIRKELVISICAGNLRSSQAAKEQKLRWGKFEKKRIKNQFFDRLPRFFRKGYCASIYTKYTKCKRIWYIATDCRAAAGGEGRGGREGAARQRAGVGRGEGHRLGREPETIKWKKSLVGKCLSREVGPIHSLVWHSTIFDESEKKAAVNRGKSDEHRQQHQKPHYCSLKWKCQFRNPQRSRLFLKNRPYW